MTTPRPFALLVVRDLALAGLLGFAPAWLWRGPGAAAGFLAACLWLGLNTVVLALLLRALTGPNSADRLLVFALACAKIPAAYLILYWLFTRDYLEPSGLVAGLTTLPLVLLLRGLASQRAA